ncbi:hypothetical protein SLOPH_605, partial [Spraguea lophii 42_110]
NSNGIDFIIESNIKYIIDYYDKIDNKFYMLLCLIRKTEVNMGIKCIFDVIDKYLSMLFNEYYILHCVTELNNILDYDNVNHNNNIDNKLYNSNVLSTVNNISNITHNNNKIDNNNIDNIKYNGRIIIMIIDKILDKVQGEVGRDVVIQIVEFMKKIIFYLKDCNDYMVEKKYEELLGRIKIYLKKYEIEGKVK